MRAGVLASAVAVAACGSNASAPACDLDPSLDGAACNAIKSLELPAQLPPSAGNAKGDDPKAASFGFAAFFDARFSRSNEVRCATCHVPENHFADGKAVSQGLAEVTRNSPTALNAARMSTIFWDGRADSIWSQPLFAFENPKEMGYTRLEIAHRVAQSYKDKYEPTFGPLPPLDDATRFPAAGKPGDPAYDAMGAPDREAVDRVVANVGKALEAYVRKLAAGRSKLDRYLAKEGDLLAEEKRGLAVFARAGCLDCHNGPLLSDERFHNLGVPAWPGTAPDRGRADAVAILRANPFNGQGAYWDGPRPSAPADPAPADLGAFRTPSLRNLAYTAPYMHNGRFASLREVVDFHLAGGASDQSAYVGEVDPLLVRRDLSDGERDDLVAFLSGALTGDYPAPPWNDWPQR